MPTAALISAGVSAASSIAGGIAQQQAGEYNAKVAQNNSTIALQNATFAAQEGEQKAGAESMKSRAEVGAIEANQGASGVETGSQSSQDTITSERQKGELNALTVRSNAARQAYGYQTQAQGFQEQAALDKAQGNQALIGGFVKAGTTILGNSSVSSAWNGYMGSQDITAPAGSGDFNFGQA